MQVSCLFFWRFIFCHSKTCLLWHAFLALQSTIIKPTISNIFSSSKTEIKPTIFVQSPFSFDFRDISNIYFFIRWAEVQVKVRNSSFALFGLISSELWSKFCKSNGKTKKLGMNIMLILCICFSTLLFVCCKSMLREIANNQRRWMIVEES